MSASAAVLTARSVVTCVVTPSWPGAAGSVWLVTQPPRDQALGDPSRAELVAVVPLKAGPTAKSRLAASLSPAGRLEALWRTFRRVTAAAAAAPSVGHVLVVVGDDRARVWSAGLGLETLEEPSDGIGLTDAVAAADAWLGAVPTLVLPADLPLVEPEDLEAVVAALPQGPGVVVAPTTDGGTGALLRAPGGIIPPCYGPGSARAHLDAAAALGVAAVSLDLPGLALDLDRPEDLLRVMDAVAASARRYDPLRLHDPA